ncbi:hypothetical protein PUNSTDRAFT_133465 [Punctularia strigosozonata HHB-11173 SS5]|uniref:uncharacterized protein n=1 Tax=Punctularia strigosozonata (strain HHB-11173) TaxID=741275 RepID=UPI00044162D1|nr:uncharacterized protein PUNSTDRAFT_133465 [Punctularia strigosozonata HHB-11173 SS5]EIN09689.1 hypothetical protein PUNSTDRAFT_133465 [Punctularia strigosozonata HHB-11173 SS5]
MTSVIQLLLVLLYSSSTAFSTKNHTAPLPQDIFFITPPSTVPLNAVACVGWQTASEEDGKPAYFGLGTDYHYVVLGPNNDVLDELSLLANMTVPPKDGPSRCWSPPIAYGKCIPVPQSGTYTLSLNVTYHLSSNISQVDRTNPCGSDQFSTQTFRVNTTFEASDTTTSASATISGVTSTATFPTTPTGLAKTSLSGSKGFMQPAACMAAVVCGIMGSSAFLW